MMWFDKKHPNAVFMDIRSVALVACDGRKIEVNPDLIGDFRKLPFANDTFKLVLFDPPHDMYAGKNSFTAQKYGKLDKGSWRQDLKLGFDECMRVLDLNGILVFKWNELRVPVNEIIKVFGNEPLFGHKSGKSSKTHWLIFMKLSS